VGGFFGKKKKKKLKKKKQKAIQKKLLFKRESKSIEVGNKIYKERIHGTELKKAQFQNHPKTPTKKPKNK